MQCIKLLALVWKKLLRFLLEESKHMSISSKILSQIPSQFKACNFQLF